MGKVVVRDSVGASRAWDDFGVRFTDLNELVDSEARLRNPPPESPLVRLEELLEQSLEAEEQSTGVDGSSIHSKAQPGTASLHKLLLTRILASHTLATHETFLHPVACVIAISSGISQPIDTLRQLYAQTAQGSKTLSAYVNPEYLRYYVLVHDEDNHDFAKSSTLFDQMKRHFGLHCHLLRLRSQERLQSDDDSVEPPATEWLSPAEELENLQAGDDLLQGVAPTPYLFDADVNAIKSLVRELIAQSVVPHMENRIALWNEQFASRRRGISGRFMSLSKKWTGFGTTSRAPSSAAGPGGGASGNYDSLQGYYNFETPEAILRKLADYALMLRDYKLASSTYELLRSDYNNDKAWKHLAGANEMCAVSGLLNPLIANGKQRLDGFEQMLETATYSYLTRCSDHADTLRAMVLGVELLRVRGRTAAEMAAKWATRILDYGLVGQVGHVLVTERVATCFSGQAGSGSGGWGSRRRKAALWNVVAADEWMKLGKADFASDRLQDADYLYGDATFPEGSKSFKEMSSFLEQLELAVRIKLGQARQRGSSAVQAPLLDADDPLGANTEEMAEQLDFRPHRRSVMSNSNPLETAPISPIRGRRDPLLDMNDDDDFGAAPLSPVRSRTADPLSRDDDFE